MMLRFEYGMITLQRQLGVEAIPHAE